MRRRFLGSERRLSTLVVSGLLCAATASAVTLVPDTASAEQKKGWFDSQLTGGADEDYESAGVKQADGTYRFTKDSKISYTNEDDDASYAIQPEKDVRIDASGKTLRVEARVVEYAPAAAIKNDGKNLTIQAGTLQLDVVAESESAAGIQNDGGTTTVTGTTDINIKSQISSTAVESKNGTVTLDGLKASVTRSNNPALALFAGTGGKIFVNAKDGTAGSHTVHLSGNVAAMAADSRIDVAMVNEQSGLDGVAYGKGTINFHLQSGAAWHNDAKNSFLPQTDRGLGKTYDYNFTGSRVTSLVGGSDAAHAGVIYQKDSRDIAIDKYSGHTRVFYEHNAAKPTEITGGDFRIKQAAAGSGITLTTDSKGLNTEAASGADKALVESTLNALAQKLYYTAYTNGEQNLTGKVEIAEGLLTSSVSKRVGSVAFSAANGQGSLSGASAGTPGTPQQPPTPKPPQPQPPVKPQPQPQPPVKPQPQPQPPVKPQPQPQPQPPVKPQPQPQPQPPVKPQPQPQPPVKPQPQPQPPVKPQPQPQPPAKPEEQKPSVQPKVDAAVRGAYETKAMRGIRSAMTASAMTWRAEANDLMKRMGDLRLSPQDMGVWARVYRGKSTSDKNNTDFRMNYATVQIGYDRQAGKAWRVGIAGSYMNGSAGFANGSGKSREGNLGVYGTWSGKHGDYVDIIAKAGRLSSEYTVYGTGTQFVRGDYSVWGGSLSAEYGRRIHMQRGSFVEPQAEMIYSYLSAVDYTADTDHPGIKMYVHQKPFDSLIGRIGIGIGKESARSTYYARASLYHEFAGSFRTEYTSGGVTKHTAQSSKDTWLGLQLGGTIQLAPRTNLYGNFEKTFGGDIQTAWRMDAGVRWSF